MKIAQVPPLYESVPPKLYGGTERIVSYLTDELVNRGHDVTLFGTRDSQTLANVIPICDQGLRLNTACKDPIAWHIYQMQVVLEHAHAFDIIHFHNDYLHYPFSAGGIYKHITTLHGRLDLPDLVPIYQKFTHIPLVSISDDQRKPLKHVHWVGTVHHGLPEHLYHAGAGNGEYLAFLGRISEEKGPERAIEIAMRAGIKLKIAAKIDDADKKYFEHIIKPLLDHPLIEFIGEVNEAEKQEFLGNAKALLFPINWPEPFGLVMIESIACGTPVIAFGCGSVPEIIDQGQTGFIVNSIDEAINSIKLLDTFDRKRCREVFEKKFTSSRMAEAYLKLYELLIKEHHNLSGRGQFNSTSSMLKPESRTVYSVRKLYE
jgi:glycosyltransferase involved in cell wall biosynthesis